MTETAAPLEGTPLIAPSSTEHELYDAVVEACRTIFDPEIPVNIYDLGLIYTINIKDDNEVLVIMTLTAAGCPVAGEMPGIDIYATYDPTGPEAYYHMIMTTVASASAFPAVHPFSVIVKLARNRDRFAVLQ